MKLFLTVIWVVSIILWVIASFQGWSNIGFGISQILLIMVLIIDCESFKVTRGSFKMKIRKI